jgi:hypothetical protein
MPKLSFSFRGWVSRADIIKASDVNGKEIDVSQMKTDELEKKLNSGELFISLGDHLYSSGDAEIEMVDFEMV